MRNSKGLLLVLCLILGMTLLFSGCRASAGDDESFVEAMVREVAMSGCHTLFVLEDNTLWGVGSNQERELGVYNSHRLISERTADEMITYTYRPLQIMTDVETAGGGRGWSVALKTDGTLWFMGKGSELWGSNAEGKPSKENTLPVQIMSDVKSFACSEQHLLILKQDGSLWGLGNSNYGQLATLGPPHLAYSPLNFGPVQLAEGVASVFAGYRSTFFIDEQSRLFSCGGNGFGELGYLPSADGESSVVRSEQYTANAEPRLVMEDVSMVAAGNTLTLIMDAQGNVFGAGRSKSYEFGFQVEQTEQPLAVASGVKRVAVGTEEQTTRGFSLLLMEDDTLWGMGANQYGQLQPSGPAQLTEPTKLLDEVESMWASNNAAIVLTLDGKLVYQGKCDCGELGRKAD